MSSPPPSEHGEASASPILNAQLVQWMAIQALQDRYARLADGGADADTRIELARLFIDLPVSVIGRGGGHRPQQVMSLVLGGCVAQPDSATVDQCAVGGCGRWLLLGGPGSGKSTLTTMVSQQLRLPWIERQRAVLPPQVREPWERAREGLTQLATRESWADAMEALPLRVSLPSLARWMATCGDSSSILLWDYLASRLVDDLASHGITSEITPPELRALVEQETRIAWILDGLDEVPPSAGRSHMIEVVRATVCDVERRMDGVLVSTRPQGYEREFDDLDELELCPLPAPVALGYAERLLNTWWAQDDPAEARGRLEKVRSEFAKPEVVELIQTPLHTTMAALLVANRGSLPSARSMLFEHYFATILNRELNKPFDHGIQDVDTSMIRALHARAGLVLQARSQAQTGARSSLRRRELRKMLAALYGEFGHDEDSARVHVDRIMRFAAERLVLLLHSSEGEYEFGVRSLQEFFAAQALLEGEAAMVRRRLDAIALNPHWSNVLAFVVSHLALMGSVGHERALMFTVELCKALNAGDVGGQPAARCFMGSRLAIQMLSETERYGHPWLHDPLWEVALEAATSPAQSAFAQVEIQTIIHHHHQNQRGVWTIPIEVHTRLGLLAGKWAGTNAARHRQHLIEIVERLFGGDEDQRLNGWRLLHGLLLQDLPEAIRIADANAPSGRGDVHRVVLAIQFGHVAHLSKWWGALAEQHPGWFLLAMYGYQSCRALVFDILNQLRKRRSPSTIIPIGWEVAPELRGAQVLSVDADGTTWQELEGRIPDEPAWEPWKYIVKFLSSPSHGSLADLLDAAGNEETFEDLKNLSRWLSWPASSCMAHAQTPEDLLELATEVREGSLGTIEDWRAAEARWRQSPQVSLDDVGSWLDADAPWNYDIASHGIVSVQWLAFDAHAHESAAHIVHEWLLDRIGTSRAPSRREIVLLGQVVVGALAIPLHVARHLGRQYGDHCIWHLPGITQMLPDLWGPESEDWFVLLDGLGREGENRCSYYVANDSIREGHIARLTAALIERIREHPEQWGLLDALRVLLFALPDTDISKLALPMLPDDAPPLAVATRSFLLLLSGRFESPELPSLLAQLGERLPHLAIVLRQRTHDHANTLSLLLAALDTQPSSTGDTSAHDALLGALFAYQRRSVTPAFTSPEEWSTHELPQPFLELAPAPRCPPRLVSITELSNLRLFSQTPTVDVPFPQPSADRGQWLVLIGENGVGKTTLLRALALTLASATVASKLLDERLPMIRNGSEGLVTIELDSGPLSIAVTRSERTERVESRSADDVARPWVVGYGVRRGNARGEKDRGAEVGPIGELHSLFDRPASLHNAAQWLNELDADVLREQQRTSRSPGSSPGPREGIWRSVEHALRVLLGITEVEVDEGGVVHVRHPQFGRVRLDALSDGYLTTAGWVIDMLARWIDRQQELDELVGADLLGQMCGFVLIDEIDLHLHPMWQMKIVEDIRRLFPRLSFVVTTHNPLTLQGARRGEVYVMRREGSHIELNQRDIRPGHDVDRVLFEQFGVEHTFDRETRDLLDRHREMVERDVPEDDVERVRVEGQLTRRFGGVGDTLSGERADARAPVAPLRPDERSAFASRHLKKA